jgi:hypothetical protein
LPKHKLGVVLLSNTDTAKINIDLLAGNILRLALEAKTGQKIVSEATSNILSEKALDQTELKAIEGSYATNMGLITIHPHGTSWRARRHDVEYQIHYHGDHWFSIPDLYSSGYLRFTRIAGLPVVIAKAAANGLEVVCGEALQLKKLPEIWWKRRGSYRIE